MCWVNHRCLIGQGVLASSYRILGHILFSPFLPLYLGDFLLPRLPNDVGLSSLLKASSLADVSDSATSILIVNVEPSASSDDSNNADTV